jgi:hypothetical protein
MTIFLIIVAVLWWLVCAALSYVLGKNDFLRCGFTWDRGDRREHIAFSLIMGPLGVLATWLSQTDKRPAKW